MWFETHAHLCDPKFDSDRDSTVERAFSNGIEKIIEIADGPAEWDKARSLAEKYRGKIWWAAGLHPYYADQGTADVFKRLKDLVSHPQFVAIGEVGLDFAKCDIPRDVQHRALRSALQLARDVQKPLIIHCREAFDELLPVFREWFKGPLPSLSPGVIHCFSGTAAEAAELIGMGFYLGVDAPITYPKAQSLRDALATVNPNKLVLETDSPYLPPQNHRGQRNEPSYLPLVGEQLAKMKNLAPENLATILRQNSCDLFRLN